ncbi:MAG: FAD-binding protein [Clostridiales bacterium]|nr:FAD-binding protein [Clostridiales bacterium]
MEKYYDVIILGGGVAGMSASIYAKRKGKKVLIIEKVALGGQVSQLSKIENFPSQAEIDGFSLSQKFVEQINYLNVDYVFDEVVSVDLKGIDKKVVCKNADYQAKSVVIATGLSNVELGIGENEFLGRGVSFCAVCDANFFKNKIVCVASKKGSGIADAKILANLCKKVILLDSEDMSVFEKANQNQNIEVLSKVKIVALEGKEKLEKLVVRQQNKEKRIYTDGLFIALGKVPSTKMFEGRLKLDEKGFVLTNEYMLSSIENVYAVGDVRSGVLKQIVTACSDGAIAGQQV